MGSEKDTSATIPTVNFEHPAAATVTILDPNQNVVIVMPRREKVALCGYASSTRMLAPWDDPAYEIWGLNQLYRFIPRADRWFEIHANWEEHVVEGTDHIGWLKTARIPIYMKERHAEFPTSLQYPIAAMIEEFGDYFTNSIAFMLALAIKEGFKEIAIFGVDMVVGTEYFDQKACVEYWIGVANGRGINVRIPPQSALCKQSHRYGYELEPTTYPLKLSDLQARISELRKKRHEAITQVALLDGAIQDAEYWHEIMTLRLRGGVVPT